MNEKVKELYGRLKQGVRDIFSNNRFMELLRLQARFHKYSFGNVLLIWTQRPDATMVAGFNTWKPMGRYVKKGEKGIKIFAPCPVKVKKKNPDTGEEIEDSFLRFKVATVFDVAQTEGKPLPEPEIPVMGDTSAGRKLYTRLVEASPVPVRFGECSPGVDGYYHIDDREIVLSPGLSGDKKAAVLLHEVAHALAFRLNEQQRHKTKGDQEYVKGEVVAEGAAFVAGAYFGMDIPASFDYVAGWSKDPEAVVKWGQSVQKVAAALIDLVEKTEEKVA